VVVGVFLCGWVDGWEGVREAGKERRSSGKRFSLFCALT